MTRLDRKRRLTPIVLLLLAAAGVAYCFRDRIAPPKVRQSVSIGVEVRPFQRVLKRNGTLLPVREEHIMTKVRGTIAELIEEGRVVEKNAIVMKLDATPHEDLKIAQEALIDTDAADHEKIRQQLRQSLNAAKEDVNSYELRVQLEQSRLDELKKGPTPTDEVNSMANIENNKLLLTAMQDEEKVMAELAAGGYIAKDELRQKQLEVTEQHLRVIESELAHQKMHIIDEARLADQDLRVRDMTNTRNNAIKRVALLEQNFEQNEDRYKRRIERAKERLQDLVDNIERTVYRAPGPGVSVYKRNHWMRRMGAGTEVYDGQEVLSLPDLSNMKVNLTVDEAHIGFVALGQTAQVTPAGWTGKPFKATVTKIADKGRDEFESYQEDTIAISGTANRQVFDVEVEIEGVAKVLRPGLRAQVEITLEAFNDVAVVPRAALQRDKEGKAAVQVEHFTGNEERKIKVLSDDGVWAAVEGLKAGERVVLFRAGSGAS